MCMCVYIYILYTQQTLVYNLYGKLSRSPTWIQIVVQEPGLPGILWGNSSVYESRGTIFSNLLSIYNFTDIIVSD